MNRLLRQSLGLLTLLSPGILRGEELRAVRFELPGLFRDASPEQIVENIASIRFNTLMCTVSPAVLEDFRFREVIRLAHARGLRLHSVLSTMVPGQTGPPPSEQPDPETHAVDSSGQLVKEWLCPSRPKVRAWARDLAGALVKLGVDGLQLDYIRFGGPDLCYCPVCRRDSETWLKAHPGRSWEDWRDSVITSFVREVRQSVKAINPSVVFSCSTWTVGDGQRRSLLTPEGEGYGWRQGQDFRQLSAEVDFLRPMLYHCMLREDAGWVVDMTRLAVGNAQGRAGIVSGVGLTIEEDWKQCQIAAVDLPRVVEGIRAAGAEGIAIFSYTSLFDPRHARLGYLEQLRRLFK